MSCTFLFVWFWSPDHILRSHSPVPVFSSMHSPGLTTPVEMKLKLIPILKQMHRDISTASQVSSGSYNASIQSLPDCPTWYTLRLVYN